MIKHVFCGEKSTEETGPSTGTKHQAGKMEFQLLCTQDTASKRRRTDVKPNQNISKMKKGRSIPPREWIKGDLARNNLQNDWLKQHP